MRSLTKKQKAVEKNDTWLYFQRAAVDLNVQPLGRRTAEVLQHTLDGFRHVIGDRLVQLHPAVHHNAAVPEVENLQLLESCQVGLQVGQELWSTRGKASQTPVPPCRPPVLQKLDLVFIRVWLVMGVGTMCRAARDVKSGRISTRMIGLMTGSEVSCVSKAPSPR